MAFVRVDIGFYTHRKTIRLFAKIGESAFWVPPRLWAYAAAQQIDGDFHDYSATEIALLIGYQNDAQAMLQALIECGFMDVNPLRIHDWEEYNAYHAVFSTRAKNAARVRWEKERTKEKDKEKRRDEMRGDEQASPSIAPSNASSMDAVITIFERYPRHEGRSEALTAIRKALKIIPASDLIAKVDAYASAVSRWPQDCLEYVPWCQKWMNKKRWMDDPSSWERNGHRQTQIDYSKGF